MVAPEPFAAPVTFVAPVTVQVNVVPDTAFGLVIATLVLCPEQIVWFDAEASGVGLTVTT